VCVFCALQIDISFLTYLLNNLFHSDLTKHLSNTTDKSCSSHGVKGQGKRFLHGTLICPNTLSDIYVEGLCIISVKLNFEN